MKLNYHENDKLFKLSSKRNNCLLNKAFKWVQGEQAVTA